MSSCNEYDLTDTKILIIGDENGKNSFMTINILIILLYNNNYYLSKHTATSLLYFMFD